MGEAWTADQDAALFRLYITEGHSASQTARLLPGPCRGRNSIIGRAHRLGFSRGAASAPRVKASYPERVALKRRRGGPALAAPTQRTHAPAPATGIEHPDTKPWSHRVAGECAFPVGDVTGADQLSCCNLTGGPTYCRQHAAIMFNGCPTIHAPAARKSRARTFEAWAA